MRRLKHHVDRMNGHKLAAVFIASILLIAGALIVRSRQTAAADLKLCHYQQQDRNVLRSILVLARTRSPHTPESEGFYRAALALAPPIDCKALPSRLPHLVP